MSSFTITEKALETIKRDEQQVSASGNFLLGQKRTIFSNVARRVKDEFEGNRRAKEKEGTDYIAKTGDAINLYFGSTGEGDAGISEAGKSLVSSLTTGAENLTTLLNTVLFKATEEGVDPNFNIKESYSALVENIPFRYREDIISSGSLPAAMRSRERVLDKLKVEEVISQQYGGGMMRLAGQLVDLDLVLTPIGFGAGKYAAMGAKGLQGAALRKARLMNSAFSGAKAGAASGALLGGVDMLSTEGSGFDDAVIFTSLGALTGGILGTGFGVLGNAFKKEYYNVGDDYVQKILDLDDKLLTDPNAVDVASIPAVPRPIEKSKPKKVKKSKVVRLDKEGKKIRGSSNAWIDVAEDWVETSGFNKRREEVDKWLLALANSPMMAFMGSRLSQAMYDSKAATLRMLGGTIFESPTTLNTGPQATAAALEPLFHNRIYSKLDGFREDFAAYAKEIKATAVGDRTGTVKDNILPNILSQDQKRELMKKVMLERNARALGKETTNSPTVRKLADKLDDFYDEAYDILSAKGLNAEQAVKGFGPETNSYIKHYQQTIWNGNIYKFITSAPEGQRAATREAITKGLAANYKVMNDFDDEVANAVALAVVGRAINNGRQDFTANINSLMSGDGRKFLQETLEDSGLSKSEIKGLMKRLNDNFGEESKLDIAKKKNLLDLSAKITLPDGKVIDTVDLMANDLITNTQRYARKVSGASALARHGIRSRAERNAYIDAMMDEQEVLIAKGVMKKNDLTRAELEALFSAFDGGARKGTGFDGKLVEQGYTVSAMKRLTNIAWLDSLGLTQLIESGMVMTQYGIGSFFERSLKPMFDKSTRTNRQELLEDLSWTTGKLGREHEFMATHLDLDEISKLDGFQIQEKVREYGSNLSYIQSYLSGFNHVRGYQQTTAALGASDKLFRNIKKAMGKDGKLNFTKKQAARMFDDFGADETKLLRYAELIKNGTVKFRKNSLGMSFVDSLNVKTWPKDLSDEFGSSIMRSVNQAIQKSLAGEQDTILFTKAGALLTHLITFPMQAFSKQAIRHLKHRDMEALTGVMYTIGASLLVSYLKDALSGKERSTSEHVARAIAYSNMLGWVPLVSDPLGTMLGIDEMRFNGRFTEQSTIIPPSVKMLNNAYRLPGSAFAYAKGEANYKQMESMRTLPFTNLIGIGTMFNIVGQRNSGKDDVSNYENVRALESLRNLGGIYPKENNIHLKDIFSDFEGLNDILN